MIPEFLKEEIERSLSKQFNTDTRLKGSTPVTGGCINSCFRLETSSGNLFLKYNFASRYPKMFDAESRGLRLLHKAGAIPVPQVIASGEIRDLSYLILEWIDTGVREKNFWKKFGGMLAKLHRNDSENFGLDHDNYIGSLAQSNRQSDSWIHFFIQERLEPQIRIARDAGVMNSSLVKMFSNLFIRLPGMIPGERPSLLHGDLWSGNFLVGKGGGAAVIDPAVYYGHREMDLAMTKLFGGFDSGFYEAYEESFPLQEGFDSRVDIHNLYPLMVHVNLFGGGYLHQVQSILKIIN